MAIQNTNDGTRDGAAKVDLGALGINVASLKGKLGQTVAPIDEDQPEKSEKEIELESLGINLSALKKKITAPAEVNIGAKGSIADRHNNPGNLVYVGQPGATEGEPKAGGGFWAKFENPTKGYEALKKDIELKKAGRSRTGITGDSTVEEYFRVYAPPTENDTNNYIATVAKQLGVSPDTPISQIPTDKLAERIVRYESGTTINRPTKDLKDLVPKKENAQEYEEQYREQFGTYPEGITERDATYRVKKAQLTQEDLDFYDEVRTATGAERGTTGKGVLRQSKRYREIDDIVNYIPDVERDEAKGAIDILNQKLSEIQKTEDEISAKGYRQIDNEGILGFNPRNLGQEALSREDEERLRLLTQNKRLIREAKKYYDAVANGDKRTATERFIRGLGTLDVANLVTIGLKDLLEEVDLTRAKNKLASQGIEALSQEEKDYLVLDQILREAQQAADSDRAFSVGVGVAESAPFMAAMVATSGPGALVRGGVYGSRAMTALRSGTGVARAGGKAVGKLASTLSDATVRSLLMPATYEKTLERTSPSIQIGEGEMGQAVPEIAGYGEPLVEAFLKATGTNAVEVFSETFVGGTLNRALFNASSKGVKVFGGTKVAQVLDKINRVDNPFLKRAFIQDPFSEYGEEVFAGIVEPIITGDGSPADFFEAENMIRTAYMVGFMTIGAKSTSIPFVIAQNNQITKGRRIVDKLNPEASAIFDKVIASNDFDEQAKGFEDIFYSMFEGVDVRNKETLTKVIAENQAKLGQIQAYAIALQRAKYELSKVDGAAYLLNDKIFLNKDDFMKAAKAAIDTGNVPQIEVKDDQATANEVLQMARGEEVITAEETAPSQVAEPGAEMEAAPILTDTDAQREYLQSMDIVVQEDATAEEIQELYDNQKQQEDAQEVTPAVTEVSETEGVEGREQEPVRFRDTEQDTEVEGQEAVTVKDGQVTANEQFSQDIQDEVTKKAVETKQKALVAQKQKALDKERESIEKEIERIDKAGVAVDYSPDDKPGNEKRYVVKKKADGTFSVFSQWDKKRVTNTVLKGKILERYNQERDADVKKLRDDRIAELDAKYSEEINQELNAYVAQRVAYAEKKAGKEADKKAKIPKKAKETKTKMPLPSEGTKVTVSDMAAMRDKIKAEEKASREAKKMTDAEYRQRSKAVLDLLKETKKLLGQGALGITDAQYASLIRRLNAAAKVYAGEVTDVAREKALSYAYEILDQAYEKRLVNSLTKAINDILSKKRTTIKAGKRKMIVNRPVIDRETGEAKTDPDTGEVIMRKVGVSPDAFTYIEQARQYMKDAEVLRRAQRAIDKRDSGKELSAFEQTQIDRVEGIMNAFIQRQDDAYSAIYEGKDAEKVRQAQVFLQMAQDFGGLQAATPNNLRNILNKLTKIEEEGAVEMDKVVQESIDRYNEIAKKIHEGLEGYDLTEEKLQQFLNRRREFEIAMQESLAKDKSWMNRLKQSYKRMRFNLKENDIKSFVSQFVALNNHLETVLNALDSSKNKSLVGYIISSLQEAGSNYTGNKDIKSNQAFGRILEIYQHPLIDELRKDFNIPKTEKNVIKWMQENKKMNFSVQQSMRDATSTLLHDLGTIFTDRIEFQELTKKNVPLNGLEALKVYIWSMNPKVKADLAKQGITDQVINEKIIPVLPDWAKEWANWVVSDFMREDYNETNDVFMRLNRINLNREDNYFPIERHNVKPTEFIGNTNFASGITEGMYRHLTTRVDNTKNPLKIVGTDISSRGQKLASYLSLKKAVIKTDANNFIEILNNHIDQSEHYKAMAQVAKDMSVVFNGTEMKAALVATRLDKLAPRLVDYILNGHNQIQKSYASSFLGKMFSSYASVQLAFKISMVAKQWSSFPAGMAEVDVKDLPNWMKHHAKLYNPAVFKEVFQEMYANSPRFKERVDNALLSDPDLRGNVQAYSAKLPDSLTRKIWHKALNSWIPAGDQLGVIMGYAPIYMAEMEKTGDRAEAIRKFERYEASQQTRSPLYMTMPQMESKDLARMVLLFSSTPILYLNKFMQSSKNIMQGYKRGGIEGIKSKDVSGFIIYGWVANAMFTTMSSMPALMFGADDEYWKKMRSQVAMGPVAGIFFFGSVIQWMAGMILADDKYSLQIVRDVEQIFEKPGKMFAKGVKDQEISQMVLALTYLPLYYQGVPVQSFLNTIEGFAEIGDGDWMSGLLKASGYTKGEVEKAKKAKEPPAMDMFGNILGTDAEEEPEEEEETEMERYFRRKESQ